MTYRFNQSLRLDYAPPFRGGRAPIPLVEAAAKWMMENQGRFM